MTWHECLKKTFGSNRKAADYLFSEWNKKAGKKEVERDDTTPTALANRIGSLSTKGDRTGWWRERPILQQLLADLVELEVVDIFEAGQNDTSSFREFPALPGLERDEAPFRTSRAGSVFDVVLAAIHGSGRRHWIVVPPGGGKSLAIELLRSRRAGEVDAQTVTRLSNAVPTSRERAYVVEVEESDSSNDLATANALEMHPAPVVVLAPFRHPDARLYPDAASFAGRGNWVVDKNGGPEGDWIVRMLDWIDQRLALSARDTKFDSAAAREWIEKHPAVLHALQSPGDLLALCADLDLHGNDGVPHERAERWLRAFGMKAIPQEAPRSWIAYVAEKCVLEMVSAHALDRTTVLDERDYAGWSRLVPSSASSEDALGCERIVGLLRSAGLLRADRRGAILFPKWVGNALAQQRVVHTIKERDVQTWGAIAGDISRQSLVDNALDALASNERRAVGEELLKKKGKLTFAETAALEAMVAALGRQLASNDHDPKDAELARLALTRQLAQLVSSPSIGPLPVPMTRRDREEWFVTGWSISLGSKPGNVEVPANLRWVLPGWSSSLLLTDGSAHSQIPWSAVQPVGASIAVQQLIHLAPKAVARLKRSEVPIDVPRLLLPALFLDDGWPLTYHHFEMLRGSWEAFTLAEALRGLDEVRQQALATRFWNFASEAVGAADLAPVAERIVHIKNRHVPLFPFVMEHLPTTIVEDTARRGGTHRRMRSESSYMPSDPGALRYLSREQRAAAVRGRLAHEIGFDEARELVEVLDGDDLDALLEVVRMLARDAAGEFAARVWRVLPERAEVETRQALDEQRPAAEAWFRSAPRERLGQLLGMIAAPKSEPAWLRDWALARLLDAGNHAEALFEITRLLTDRAREPAGRKRPSRSGPK